MVLCVVLWLWFVRIPRKVVEDLHLLGLPRRPRTIFTRITSACGAAVNRTQFPEDEEAHEKKVLILVGHCCFHATIFQKSHRW
jgi:Ni,Fe-hydrogenase III small subunit